MPEPNLFEFEEPSKPLAEVREDARVCQRCDLWKLGTQTVFGEGPTTARIMMIGEAPGDKEDRAGRPFVGPAGQLLDQAMEQAGVDRSQVYVTNAVKHFKWIPQGARRLHQKPNRGEIQACHVWLEAELANVRPEAIVLLGATAAQSLLGADFKITQNRGRRLDSALADLVLATFHPSAILRMPDEALRAEAFQSLVQDLRVVQSQLPASPKPTLY